MGLGRRVFSAGEVLTASNVMNYLQDQVVMNFAGTAARGSAIGTAVQAGMVSYLADNYAVEVYRTSGSVANWDRIDSPQSNNFLINGAFDIWQRGTSGFSSGYFADRWFLNGANSGSRSTDVPSAEFSYSVAATNTSNNYAGISQRIESTNAKHLVGKYVTVSGWFKRTGTTPGLSLTVNMDYPTAVDNYSSATYVSAAVLTASAPSTSWTKYTATFPVVVPTQAANGLMFTFKHDGASGNNLGGLWAGLQIEVGLSATPFRRNQPNIQAELAACQRYYQVFGGDPTNIQIGQGTVSTSTNGVILIPLLVEMRAAPSFSYGGTLSDYRQHVPGVIISTTTAFTLNVASTKLVSINTSAGSGFTPGHCVRIDSNGANARFFFTSEL